MTDEAMILGESHVAWASVVDERTPLDAAQFDYQLAQRIAGGDMRAFEQYYQRYHRRVYSLCWRMIRNREEAEDMTQEIFIHVYHKIGSFRGESTMITWLHRVTVNQVLMHFRKSSAQREQTTDDGTLPEPKSLTARPLDQLLALDRLALDGALARLPYGYRAVFVLHDVEGYEHAEIARMLGIAVGTSKSQLHKARARLCALLRARPNLRASSS